MISYRQADIFKKIKEKNETPVAKVTSANYQKPGKTTSVTALMLKFISPEATDKSEAIKLFESIYESLPNTIRDHYKQNPDAELESSLPPYDHILTIVHHVDNIGNWRPGISFTLDSFDTSFENRGMKSSFENVNSPRPVAGGYREAIGGEFYIKRSNFIEKYVKADIFKRFKEKNNLIGKYLIFGENPNSTRGGFGKVISVNEFGLKSDSGNFYEYFNYKIDRITPDAVWLVRR